MVMSVDSIETHPHIHRSLFVQLFRKFCALDSTLTLHYANHTTDAVLYKMLEAASDLARCRITSGDLEHILAISPSIYTVYKDTSRENGVWLKLPDDFTQAMIHTRKAHFAKDINQWIRQNQETKEISCQSIEQIARKHKMDSSRESPTKITKPGLKRKPSLLETLKNDTSKFTYQERSELVEQQKSKGLTLLERIKLKEKLRKQESDLGANSPEVQYNKYLVGKIKSVYDILYQESVQNRSNENTITFSHAKLTQTVVDSLDYPIEAQEVADVLSLVQARLGADKVQILERNKVKVVKVGELDRKVDLELMKGL